MIISNPLLRETKDAITEAMGGEKSYSGKHDGKLFNGQKYSEDLKKTGYTADEAREYWSNPTNTDPYSRAYKEITKAAEAKAPKVSIEGNKIVVSASKSVLESPFVSQLNEQLKSLKGSDLKNPEVVNAINLLNEEIRTNAVNSIAENTLGWTPDEYNDYNSLIQTISSSNPMSSKNYYQWAPKGKILVDDKGEPVKKTPDEWREYWQTHYSAAERGELFKESYQSNNPYERTMALILGQGSDKPIYGFSTGERISEGLKAAGNQLYKLPSELLRTILSSQSQKEMDKTVDRLDIPPDAMRDLSIQSESQFQKMKETIKGKSWKELDDSQKAFVATLAVANVYGDKKGDDKEVRLKGKDGNGLDVRLGQNSRNNASIYNLDNLGSEDDNVSRRVINDILGISDNDEYYSDGNFKKYKEIRDNYDTWSQYSWESTGKTEEELAKTAFWSGAAQNLGNIGGNIGRYLWESAVIRGLTGGINPSSITNPRLVTGDAAKALASGGLRVNAISDVLGEKVAAPIIRWLEKVGESPLTPSGRNMITFAANLAGTIPEDILQTSIDNVLTYNEQDNEALLDPSQMSENFKNNLIMMSLFNMARAGVSSVKRAKAAKAMRKMEDLNQIVNIDGLASDADDLARAVKKGQTPNVEENGKVTIIDENFNEKPLENVTPEQAEMVQMSLFDQEVGAAKTTMPADQQRLKELELRRQNWVDNDYKDESGNDVRARAQTDYSNEEIPGSSELEKLDAEIESIKNRLDQQGDAKIDTTKGVGPETPKVTVEVDTPDGPVRVETTDYRPKSLGEALKIIPEATPAGVKQWHTRSLETAMNDFTTHLQNFHDKFGDVQASDFDWVWYNTKKGLTPEQIIGTTDPATGRIMDQNKLDAMKWWQDQPFTKDLRVASREALGMDGDFNVLGYLPHTVYDPSNASFEEALTGRGTLWQTSTGNSVLGDNMQYKGFGGDFNSRYRTLASNLLWDAKTKDIAASKVVEEAQMEGVDLAPEQARRVVSGAESIQSKVNESSSTKALSKALESDGDTDFKKIAENTEKDAKNSGLGQAMHDNWGEVYSGQNSARVGKQRKGIVNSLDTQANFLRNTQTADGSMYENGAADIVYHYGNAMDLVSRYMDPNDTSATNLRDAIVDYYTQHGRPQKYAEIYADKAMARIGEIEGPWTKAKVVDSLSQSMKWEAWSRLRRWLVRADYNQFNSSTKKYIDQFLFNHMQMESIKNNPKITKRLGKALDVATGLRYRALFYGNIKNALLQTSELNRYFSAFKWGDVAKMAKRLATDEGFRARVDTYVDIVAPKTSRLDADLYGKYSNIADSMEVQQDGVKFKDLGNKAKETADAIGLGPIEAAESFKNRMMVAGLVQEADSLGLSGDEALRHIRRRFERVALAADEMGKIGMSSSPLARTALFLQNFQIRELGMHLYNILDETGMAKSTPKKILNASKYLTKVFGAKLATTLILARLGYSASQTMGLDPFGLLDNYNQMDEEDMNWVDQQIAGGLLTPFFSGGMTSLLSDLYFMGRKAYEDSMQQTVSDEAEESLDDSYGWKLPEGEFSWENLMEGARNFIPGNVTANRISQMNEMMDTGWATSSTGNKIYSAPTDPLNTLLGYLFGRSATRNAQQYNQTYGDNLAQTLGRIFNNVIGGDTQFDPIDTRNYSDWFKGDENDAQQFNKGRYWFQAERDRILDEYENAIKNSYASDDEIAEAKNNMNTRLDNLYDQLERFVDAYEKKNGTISSTMTKQIVNLLNTGRNVVTDTTDQAKQRSLDEYNRALERYSQLGLSPVGTYTGPSEYDPTKETKYQGSPQWRAAVSGYYNTDDELVEVLKLADSRLEPLRKQLQDKISYAYTAKDYDYLASLQNQYLKEFDQIVAPIVATYGVDAIKKNGDVENQLKVMLNSGGLIPSSQYAKNKWGKYQSMPYQEVDVGTWAKQRYGSDTYKNPTVRSYSTADEDIEEIKRLSKNGQSGRAMARALELKVRVNNQTRSLSSEDLKWLNNFLNNEGGK